MSRALATVLFLLSGPISIQAQAHATGRASFLIDGSISYTRQTTETTQFESTSSQLSLAPTVHYFVAPGFALGLTLLFRDGESETTRNQLTTSAEFVETAIGPSISYYHGSANSRWLPFMSASYTFGNQELMSPSSGAELSTRTLGGAVGVLVLLNQHVGLTGEVFLQDGTTEVEGALDRDRLMSGFRVGIATFVF